MSLEKEGAAGVSAGLKQSVMDRAQARTLSIMAVSIVSEPQKLKAETPHSWGVKLAGALFNCFCHFTSPPKQYFLEKLSAPCHDSQDIRAPPTTSLLVNGDLIRP